MADIVVDTNVFLSLLVQQSVEHTQYANKVFSAVLEDDLNICARPRRHQRLQKIRCGVV